MLYGNIAISTNLYLQAALKFGDGSQTLQYVPQYGNVALNTNLYLQGALKFGDGNQAVYSVPTGIGFSTNLYILGDVDMNSHALLNVGANSIVSGGRFAMTWTGPTCTVYAVSSDGAYTNKIGDFYPGE